MVILQGLNKHNENNEEHIKFRSNRSVTDAIFTIGRIIDMSVEYNTQAFSRFVDFTKTFDRIHDRCHPIAT